MHILVTGGRKFSQKSLLFQFLDVFHKTTPITRIIHGCAGKLDKDGTALYGADELSGEWARKNNVYEARWPANWDKYGKRAGILRNTQMIECEHVHFVMAFPGGTGTYNMCEQALSRGIDVYDTVTKTLIKAKTLNEEEEGLF